MSNLDPILLDITKRPEQILMDKFNSVNGLNLSADDFSFGLPQAQQGLFNTSVEVTPLASSRFYNKFTINYNRLDVADILNNPNVSVARGTGDKLSTIINDINAAYGVFFRYTDYDDTTLPAIDQNDPGAEVHVIFSVKSDSLIFHGIAELVLNKVVATTDPTTNEAADLFVIVQQPSDAVYKSKIVAVTAAGDIISGFKYLRNATNITTSRIDTVVSRPNNDLVLNGHFVFTASLNGGNPTVYDVMSIIMSPSGTVKDAVQYGLYGQITNAIPEVRQGSAVAYTIDRTGGLGNLSNKTYRFGENGAVDYSFDSSALGYTPTLIREAEDGTVYVASDVYVAPDTIREIRIDRLKIDGTQDPTFTPIKIRSTGNAAPWLVGDIKPIFVGGVNIGLYVALIPTTVPSAHNNVPVINTVVTVPGGETTDYGVLPVFHFNGAGVYDVNFSCRQKNFAPGGVYDLNSSNWQAGDHVLTVLGQEPVFFTNRVNPISGLLHRMPVRYNQVGSAQLISGSDYLNEFVWTGARHIKALKNGTVLSWGACKTPLAGGGYNGSVPVVGTYKADGTPLGIVYQPGAGINNDVTISDVIVQEN